jgi:subtilase family serine protease
MRRSVCVALLAVVGVLVCGAASATAMPFHVMLPGRYAQPPTIAQCEAAFGVECYGPPQIEQAYDMQPLYNAGLTGRGKTIVIVDAFGSPTIQSDLQAFDQEFNLPAPPSFKIITPDGPVDQTNPAAFGWGVETSLDVEYSHTIAPGANILLVETPVAETEGITGFPQIVEAENYVVKHHLGDVITQSFGATEQTFTSQAQLLSQRSAYIAAARHKITVLASSGDTGAADYQADGVDFFTTPAVNWPASDPLVTGVGGLELQLNDSGYRTAPDRVWNDTLPICGPPCAGSGGLSSVFGRPSYQDSVAGVVGDSRGVPDVSLNAAVSSSVDVYMSFDGLTPGFYLIGGTSEASPLFSGIVAIADQAAHHDLGLLNPALYALGDGFFSGIKDITLGNNTVTFTQPSGGPPITVPGYNAMPGYDLASGLGEPDGALLVARLAGLRFGFARR